MYRLAIVLALAIAPISAVAQTPATDIEAISKRLANDAIRRQACEAQRILGLQRADWGPWNRCMAGLPPGPPKPTEEEKRQQEAMLEIVTPIAVFTMFGLIMMAGIFCVLGLESIARRVTRAQARRHEFKRGLLG
jgi:hypothetical protein